MFVIKDEGQNLLVIGAPEHDADAYHLSGFLAPDAVICLRVASKRYLAVSSLEYGRAEKQAPVDRLLSHEELGIIGLARELKSGARAYGAPRRRRRSPTSRRSSTPSRPPVLTASVSWRRLRSRMTTSSTGAARPSRASCCAPR